MIVLGVIPARFESSRFPGKPLAEIHGKPMIQWVYERSRQAKRLTDVVVATDDERIFQAVKNFGGHVEMTAAHHLSGTDRLIEISARSVADVYINIQGDEPLVRPEMIDQVVEPFFEDRQIEVGTLVTRIDQADDLSNPNVVKVIFDSNGDALYFSRAPIPFNRELINYRDWLVHRSYWKHIGIYVYRKEFLSKYTSWSISNLEQIEKLEQLRILENGCKIRIVKTEYSTIGVDTPDDLERVKNFINHERSHV